MPSKGRMYNRNGVQVVIEKAKAKAYAQSHNVNMLICVSKAGYTKMCMDVYKSSEQMFSDISYLNLKGFYVEYVLAKKARRH